MKKTYFYLGLICLFIPISCTKDEVNQENVLEYLPLKVGNYWIYQTYLCDSVSENCNDYVIDTVTVIKDTTINGNKYFKLKGTYYKQDLMDYLRDSGHYIVNIKGDIIFSNKTFNKTLNHYVLETDKGDTIYYADYQMKKAGDPVNITLGEFDCLNYQGELYAKTDNFITPRYTNNYYSKNVGLIYSTSFYLIKGDQIKRELIGYHLE